MLGFFYTINYDKRCLHIIFYEVNNHYIGFTENNDQRLVLNSNIS